MRDDDVRNTLNGDDSSEDSSCEFTTRCPRSDTSVYRTPRLTPFSTDSEFSRSSCEKETVLTAREDRREGERKLKRVHIARTGSSSTVRCIPFDETDAVGNTRYDVSPVSSDENASASSGETPRDKVSRIQTRGVSRALKLLHAISPVKHRKRQRQREALEQVRDIKRRQDRILSDMSVVLSNLESLRVSRREDA